MLSNKSPEQSNRLLNEFLEIVPEGITILDVSTQKFIKCNSNAAKLLKFSPEQIHTKGPLDFSPEFQPCGRRSAEMTEEFIARAISGDKIVFEWSCLNGEGKSFIAEVRLVALSGMSTPHLYASFVDITGRVETAKKIESQNKKLSDIAFMQSHKMRQPVANILGLISLFNFENAADPINARLISRLEIATRSFDQVIVEIVNSISNRE